MMIEDAENNPIEILAAKMERDIRQALNNPEISALRARVAEAEARAQTAEAQVKAQSATIAMLEEENKAIRDGTAVNIVYTDGTWKVVSKRSAWEYENDPDYLVTIPFIDWKLT